MTQNDREQWEPGNWDELFPGRFLKCGHLSGETEIRIVRIYVEVIDGKPSAVFAFSPVDGTTQQDFGLNKTNGICMRAMFGDSMRDWQGKRIVVKPSKVEHGREKGKPCIRICGSPDIATDLDVVVDFHTKRIKPFVIKVRATGQRAPAQEQPSERANELAQIMAGSVDQAQATLAWEECKTDHAQGVVSDTDLAWLKRQFASVYKALAAATPIT